MRAGLALGCAIQRRSIFARKNYFYPDLPKGYQISQYEYPLATDGELAYVADDGPHVVRIIRVHLEGRRREVAPHRHRRQQSLHVFGFQP